MLGITLRWTSIPSRGEQKYSQSLHATETGISSGPNVDLTLPTVHYRLIEIDCLIASKSKKRRHTVSIVGFSNKQMLKCYEIAQKKRSKPSGDGGSGLANSDGGVRVRVNYEMLNHVQS